MRAGRGELRQQLSATLAALRRNRTARNRHQAARARHDMRTWQVERRKRTRLLIELGGLVVKAGVVDLTGDDRATIYGALLWMADKLKSDHGEGARALWAATGKQALKAAPGNPQARESLMRTAATQLGARPRLVAGEQFEPQIGALSHRGQPESWLEGAQVGWPAAAAFPFGP